MASSTVPSSAMEANCYRSLAVSEIVVTVVSFSIVLVEQCIKCCSNKRTSISLWKKYDMAVLLNNEMV